MKNISILGCGWLGLPLAKSLIDNGFSVKGSTTSVDKMVVLEKNGIIPFQIILSEEKWDGNLDLFLENSEILIIDIPPKLRGDSSENFIAKIENIIPIIEKSTIKNVIFISSTSFYSDTYSKPIVTEESIPNPNTESGKQLLQVEQLLQNNSNFKTSSIRFGGLIGNDRHPIKMLAGKLNIENPDAPINLIHLDDCIGIIEAIIYTNSWQLIVNAVTPFHPTRKNYYTQKAIDFNLALPQFEENKTSIGKTIVSKVIESILHYQFKKPLL